MKKKINFNMDDPNDIQKPQNNINLQPQAGKLLTSDMILPGIIKQRHLLSSPSRPGDLYYGKDGNAFTSLSIGTNGQILTIASGAPTWKTAGAFTQYLSTLSGFSGTPVQVCRYTLYGKLCTVIFSIAGVSNATNFTANVPFTSANFGVNYYWANGRIFDNSTIQTNGGVFLQSNSTTATFTVSTTSTTFTNSGSKGADVTLIYEIA